MTFHSRWFIIFPVLFILISACENSKSEDAASPDGESASLTPQSGMPPVISKDAATLGKVLNLQKFKPDSVVFHLSGFDIGKYVKDSIKSKSFKLEAVLYYEEHVYGSVLEKYMEEGFPKGNYEKEDFCFGWLNENLSAELNLSKVEYKGNPDIFLGTNGGAELWFSDKKVFVRWYN